MAVKGRIVGIEEDKLENHVATTWQISTTPDFREIIRQSVDDTVNTTIIEFPDLVLDKNTKYYGRARIRTLTGGWSQWRNMEVFSSDTLDAADNTYTMPSRLGAARIHTTTEGKENDYSNHPVIDFRARADGYAAQGNNKHTLTSWYIEDINRNVIWKEENVPVTVCDDPQCIINGLPQEHVCFPVNNLILEMNKCYRLRCVFISETNDVSDISSKTFVTLKEKNAALKAYLQYNLADRADIDFTADTVLTLPFEAMDINPDTVKTEIAISDQDGGRLTFSDNATPAQPTITIPGNTLVNNKIYVVKYRTCKRETPATAWSNDPWEAIYISTYIKE